MRSGGLTKIGASGFGTSRFYPWYGRNYNVGLEPFSSYPTNGIEEAIENGSALSVGPSETLRFSLRADVLEGGSVCRTSFAARWP
jgi:hypothetical protein